MAVLGVGGWVEEGGTVAGVMASEDGLVRPPGQDTANVNGDLTIGDIGVCVWCGVCGSLCMMCV